ncbi:stage V sporulation protein B [Clostridium cavendishii DSM 21758]|uniref:Stage V sporulation protein B n=1 Tax=Clostridium cavendishii DSM 21758 TaxID=1121302 RepID=A0A1M6JBV5_9CLOT|nr:polysaccharide biosynthesis protein [Clostridium cavendishii]SHJ44216.1 stage V sporulation protein B [Clostridium cavendishii DSM 21758]
MSVSKESKNITILSIAGILSKFISLFYLPLLILIIGNASNGVYAHTYDVFVFIYAITSLGMQPAISKLVAELDATNNFKDSLKTFKLARMFLIIGSLIFTLILIVFATNISVLMENPQGDLALKFLAPSVFFTGILVSYRGYFQGKGYIKPIAISQIIEQFINVSTSLLFAYIFLHKSLKLAIAGATIGTSLGAIIATLYLIFYLYRTCRINNYSVQAKKQIDTKLLVKKLFTYTLPLSLSAGLQNLGALIDDKVVRSKLAFLNYTHENINILVSYLGIYRQLLYVPLVIVTSLTVVLLPRISRSFKLKNNTDIKRTVDYSLKITYILLIPISFGFGVLSKNMYALLFKGAAGFELMLFGSVLLIFMGIVQLQSTILQALNCFYKLVISLLIGVVVKLCANYFFIGIGFFNIYGAILGGILGFSVSLIINMELIHKTINEKINSFNIILKAIIASVAMAIVIFAMDKLIFTLFTRKYFIILIATAIEFIVGIFTYGYLLIKLKGFTEKDLAIFPKKIQEILLKIFTF